MTLMFGSLFAGIAGFDLGFEQAGLRCAWQVEIDRAASGVLAHHWPDVPRYGDVRKVSGHHLTSVDVITFGSPCQDLSVAGKRAGLDGARSGLFFEAVRIIGEMHEATSGRRPILAVWENVDGALSSHRGRDFGVALDALAERGALDIGWRVLGSEWFGVAQRRNRVFVVADFGGERTEEILALTQSLRGDPPPRRPSGQDVAGTLGAGSEARGWRGDLDGHGAYVPMSVNNDSRAAASGPAAPQRSGRRAQQIVAYGGNNGSTAIDVSTSIASKNRCDFETETLLVAVGGEVTHSLTADGHDASEDGTGRGTPIIAYQCNGTNVGEAGTLRSGNGHVTGGVPFVALPFDTTQITSKANGSQPRAGGTDHPLAAGAHPPAIAFMAKDYGADAGEISPTLRSGGHDHSHANGGVMPAVAFTERTRADGRNLETQDELAYALTNPGSGGRTHSRQILSGMVVRRLMPIECERLQGFPDGRTAVSNGKAQADGPRYRQLGNAVTVSVSYWIAKNIIKACTYEERTHGGTPMNSGGFENDTKPPQRRS